MTLFDSRYSLAFSNNQSFKTVATSELIPVISRTDLANYLRLDDANDLLLQQLCSAATQFMINQLKTELISRARVVTYPNYPTIGTSNSRNLSGTRQALKTEILLPYANVISVESVFIHGVEVTEYHVKQTQPACIELDVIYLANDSNPAIVINYTAGFGNLEDIPADLKFAITMFAAYMYENRGCGMSDAFMKSGAHEMTINYNTMPIVF